MIVALDFMRASEDKPDNSPFALATVVAFFDSGAAQLQFAGESVPAEKEYPYLRAYKPVVGDKVLLAHVSGSYIILGAVSYLIAPDMDLENRLQDEETYTEELKLRLGALATISYEALTQAKVADRTPGQTIKEAINYIADYFPHSDQVGDQAGNMNIENMYVDPSTGELIVKRRNGISTSYTANTH